MMMKLATIHSYMYDRYMCIYTYTLYITSLYLYKIRIKTHAYNEHRRVGTHSKHCVYIHSPLDTFRFRLKLRVTLLAQQLIFSRWFFFLLHKFSTHSFIYFEINIVVFVCLFHCIHLIWKIPPINLVASEKFREKTKQTIFTFSYFWGVKKRTTKNKYKKCYISISIYVYRENTSTYTTTINNNNKSKNKNQI